MKPCYSGFEQNAIPLQLDFRGDNQRNRRLQRFAEVSHCGSKYCIEMFRFSCHGFRGQAGKKFHNHFHGQASMLNILRFWKKFSWEIVTLESWKHAFPFCFRDTQVSFHFPVSVISRGSGMSRFPNARY